MTQAFAVELAAIRSIPPEFLEDWLHRAYPKGRPIQWWMSMLDSMETEALKALHAGSATDQEVFRFVSVFINLGVKDSINEYHAAYWNLRFAALTGRFPREVTGLPEAMTPNGSARRALAAISMTKDKALAVNIRRYAELSDDIDGVPDEEIAELQDLEWLLPSLSWVRDRVTDLTLKTQVAEWLEVYRRMAPDVDSEDS